MNRPAFWLFCYLLAPSLARAALQTIPLPATLDGQPVGELNAVIEDEQLRSLDINPIRARLQQVLSPGHAEFFRTNTLPALPPSVLEAAGVRTRFDFQNLTADLTTATEARGVQSLDLIGSPSLRAGAVIQPSLFSAYMNVRGGAVFTESSEASPTGFSDPQLNLENAFAYHGLVLENETALNPAPSKTWEKRDTRITWDQPERRLRWELGDLDYPVTSLQAFVPMAGVSLHKEDSLQPYRLASPLGQSAFMLKQDSKVDVVVNGHTIQTLQLNAGPHQISNFPLSGGVNDVVLRITDPVGRVEYLNNTLFYDPGLLRAGESEFNYALGFPSITDPESPIYRYSSSPAASAFHRWGISDRLTAGLNAVATTDTQEGGGAAELNTFAGAIGLDSGLSYDRHLGSGYSELLQYHYYVPRKGILADGVLSAGAQYQSRGFTQPSPFATPAPHSDAWNFQASYSQRLTKHWGAGISYNRQLAGGLTTRETYDLLTSYQLQNLRASITLQRTEGPVSQAGWGAFFVLTFNFGGGHSFYTSYDTSSRASRGEWQYTPPGVVETVDTTLGLENTPTDTTGYGSIRYTGRRAELTLSQDVLSSTENRTSLAWGTALVYADGTFGVSRQVSDSFALIESTGSLRAEGGLGAQHQAQSFLAQEDWLGPAVLPQLAAYHPTPVTVEPRRAEADFDPQAGDLLLQPTFRSGSRIRLGHAATINVAATLLWSEGKPAALQAGTFTGPDGVAVEFISNREGGIYLQGLKAGTYRAALAAHPEAPFTLTVPATKEKDLNLGEIRVPIKE